MELISDPDLTFVRHLVADQRAVPALVMVALLNRLDRAETLLERCTCENHHSSQYGKEPAESQSADNG